MKNNINYLDITNELFKNAKPNSHKVKELNYWIINNKKYKVNQSTILLDYSKSELECAYWIENTFGGEIYLCPRVNDPKYIETPDYIWNNEYWDLKEINTYSKNIIDNVLNGTRKQTSNYIFDIKNNKINEKEIIKQIQKTYSSSYRKWVNKIIVKNNSNLIIAYKRK